MRREVWITIELQIRHACNEKYNCMSYRKYLDVKKDTMQARIISVMVFSSFCMPIHINCLYKKDGQTQAVHCYHRMNAYLLP